MHERRDEWSRRTVHLTALVTECVGVEIRFCLVYANDADSEVVAFLLRLCQQAEV